MTQPTKELVKEIFNSADRVSLTSLEKIAFLCDYYFYIQTGQTITDTRYKSDLSGVFSQAFRETVFDIFEQSSSIEKQKQKLAGNKYTVFYLNSNYKTTLTSAQKQIVADTAEQWLEKSPEEVTRHIKQIVPRGRPKLKNTIQFNKLNTLSPMHKRKLDIEFSS